MEQWLTCSPTVSPHRDRHNRCSCCLDWVSTGGVRCPHCAQPLHRQCARKWWAKSRVKTCPNCRGLWKGADAAVDDASEDFLKGT